MTENVHQKFTVQYGKEIESPAYVLFYLSSILYAIVVF